MVNGKEMDDIEIIEKILRLLPKRFENAMCIVKEAKDKSDVY